MVATRSKKSACLVTGGSGFLGQHLVRQLADSGRYDVTVFDLRLPATQLPGVTYVAGDLTDASQVAAACRGQQTVFHCATAAPTASNSRNDALMRAVNIDGTRHVIDACVAGGVPRLVFTSSASVVFEGRPLLGADERTPYGAPPLDAYSTTKAEAERLVLAAAGRGGLRTLALRPSGIFGEHDALMVPSIVDNARRGKLKYVIGDGRNLMDYTYAGNVAAAHIRADEALAAQEADAAAPRVSGRAFFITNDEPRPFWGVTGDICEGLGYPRPSVHLPAWLILAIAVFVVRVVVPLAALCGKTIQSDFTPARIRLATVSRTFSCEAAKRDLGYVPEVSMDEALRRTIKYFDHLKKPADVGKKAT